MCVIDDIPHASDILYVYYLLRYYPQLGPAAPSSGPLTWPQGISFPRRTLCFWSDGSLASSACAASGMGHGDLGAWDDLGTLRNMK
jgi:hypothetical protein